MPLPSSGIIVVEKQPSTASNTRITNSIPTTNTNNPSTHPPQQQQQQQQSQTHLQYYEYYDVNENQLSQQQQQHSTIVVDGTVYHQQQQQLQLGGLLGGRKTHSSLSSSSSSSNKSNLHLPSTKTGPMPQSKPYSSQQQQIIQHTSTNQQQHPHLHPQQQQQQQHVHQVNLAAPSSSHHQTQHFQSQQQQQPSQAHVIQVSEEFLEQATNNHNTSNMMISTTGEVIQQQQIFKIVSTDATTGNMIIDTSNQNPNTGTPKVLLSNLTVLSKQQHQGSTAQGQLITSNQHQQQQSQATGQTINFVNAKNLYTTSNSNISTAGQAKQKFTVATTNVASFKSSGIKQSTNTQYIQQSPSTMGQQKINISAGNRNMQMLTTTRVQAAGGNSLGHNIISSNNPAQTMVLQQPHKFINNNVSALKTTLGSGTGNVIKKSIAGTLRMNNCNSTTTATKLMNNLHTQSAQGVKTFITQTPSAQQQQLQQQNLNQLTLQHHTVSATTTKGGKSKFVKQYNNAILNSAGAVAIATLPHQQPTNSQSNQQQQQQQSQQSQSTYINHHKVGGSTNKINKINSKYGQQTAAVAAQLPPGTQLHQKTVNQSHQQQYQTTSNSNIKFVNAQGTIIQQQQQPALATHKLNNKHQQQMHQHQHHQQQYQNIQNFDTVDGNHLYTATSSSNPSSVGATTLSTSSSSLLTDDIMMVNGTQMTDEISARILQSMSQKSFSNQRYQQQHQPSVLQKSASITSNMLPPPPTQTSSQASHIQTTNSNNTNSNILLSPREYTLYPQTAAATTAPTPTAAGQHNLQQQPSSNQYNSSSSFTQQTSLNHTTAGSLSLNYMSIANNNMTTTITAHSTAAALTPLSTNTTVSGTTSRQVQSAPNSRSQSMERKLHESSITRKSTEYYKVNNPNNVRGSHSSLATSAQSGIGTVVPAVGSISSSLSNVVGGGVVATQSAQPRPSSIPPAALMEPQAQVIHLQATKTLPGANNSSNDDDDIIGEEIRPVPVETEDIRLRILHAVLFDHTYVNPMPLDLPTTFGVQLPHPPNSTASQNHMTIPATTGTSGSSTHTLQWSLGGIGAVATGVGVAQPNYAIYGSQLSRLQQDEDAYSATSNSSRLVVGDIDPGEETETAPEAELEDDSITRCICDLIHDDGYMICCDKCCAWQHVDCMGIDRQNIPDEYLCELCQPRAVDKARARSLQLLKRKEQTQLMLTTQAQAVASANTIGAAGSASSSVGGVTNLMPNDVLAVQQRLAAASGGAGFNLTSNMTAADTAALQLLAASGGPTLKKGSKMLKKVKDSVAGKKAKKAEKLAAAAAAGLSGGKSARKETKKNTKRKKAGTHDGGSSTAGMSAAEKHAANLRQWIENYELAVTNHYSPELRARLHAITKQPSLLQSILNTENPILKEFSNGSLENRATTVPHAGGKILISNLDIIPNSPICELRGKYMLTTQYKTQNTSMNMNTPPPNNYHVASYKAHKTPGPFIFFYQLPGAELTASCHLMPQTTTTTTLNPDGTYTTTTLPAQQSPPTYLKGPEISVDTRTYGNEARFVRRSCRPNAEIQHLFEKGTIHLFIVALTDIRASTEITIRHEPHDLLAVDCKRPSSLVIQPTSTPCACGLTKDCIFGPPLPQLPPAAKSNAGRKSLTFNGAGGSANIGNLTAKQRKASQQNMNRNRSSSSSASGDSNMGCTMTTMTTTTTTVAVGLNSPNNINNTSTNNITKNGSNKSIMNNNLMPLQAASCNSNMSNASSTSLSTLTSIMHDSGICTSSSSPSVSLPSPTQHMHSPIQQHQQQNQQQHQQQQQHLMQHSLVRSSQMLPQQQQQQLMQTLPTPLILASLDMPQQQQQLHQQQVLSQQPMPQIQQPLTIVHQAAATATATAVIYNPLTEIKVEKLPPTHVVTSPQLQPQQLPQQLPQPQLKLMSPQQPEQQQQNITTQPPVPVVETVLMKSISPEATIAAVALQSLNTSHSPTVSNTTIIKTLASPPPLPQQQQQSAVLMSEAEIVMDHQQHQKQHEQQPLQVPVMQVTQSLSDHLLATTASVSSSVSSSPQQQLHPQQQSQPKSPQKNQAHSHHNSTHTGRKTPAKQARTTSYSEENEHSNEDHASQPNSSSTPKEKPKLSREDRKMEAILRAIEKMERNQQRKQEQNKSKRQNSSSHNTTPTSPNKTFDSADSSTGATVVTAIKRSNSHAGTRTKKKRKTGGKGGQGGSFNAQRKRRQSRMNSHESQDECRSHDPDAMTSESDGCTAMHSPPIQTMATLRHQQPFTPTSTNPHMMPNETVTNNVDQAAGLLMAFANPDTMSSATDQNLQQQQPQQLTPQSPHRAAQYMLSSNVATASPPATPPSQVSCACLLIEAAVGPLETNLDSNNVASGEVNTTEFKYPLQAKTKKHLMNNWLHQTEDVTPSTDVTTVPEQSQPAVSGCGLMGGLDSLLQAVMSDFKQSKTVVQSKKDQPQNLSIVAQKVEEFIQQTEASGGGAPPTPPLNNQHSYEYKQQDQYASMTMTAPAVDLSIKSVSSTSSSSDIRGNLSNKNFHLPLQVSTCSNNSSVKKRWLRQAISEETHEEFQQQYSLTPSPTTQVNNTIVNPPQQTVSNIAVSSPVAAFTNHVPNGFTTPLKKRRLLLTDKDEMENHITQPCTAKTPSPPPAPQLLQPPVLNKQQFHGTADKFECREMSENLFKDNSVPQDQQHEDIDVDVEKCEANDLQHHHSEQQHIDLIPKLDTELEQDVDVISTLHDHDIEQKIKLETVTKHEILDDRQREVKLEEYVNQLEPQQQQTLVPLEFQDQEDDVDILRSPSPGREMIKADDNLVKIEPEDTSCTEDVKIDVEREESMAADENDEVAALNHESKDVISPEQIQEHKVERQPATTGNIEIKQEVKFDDTKEQQQHINNSQETKMKSPAILEVKLEDSTLLDDEEEPIPKRPKLEVTSSERTIANIKEEPTSSQHEIMKIEQQHNIKQEIKTKDDENSKIAENEFDPHTNTITNTNTTTTTTTTTTTISKKEILKHESSEQEKRHVTKTETVEVSSTTSSTLIAITSVAADSTFTGIDSATPPPPPAKATITGAVAAPIQRHKSLSDDDIQARLHSFHKENILFLQSRNKKTKSSSTNTLANNEHHKNKSNSSSSASLIHTQLHHDNKEQLGKSISKHHKNSSATPSGSSKKQKLHKRERTTSNGSTKTHTNSSSTAQLSSSTSAALNRNKLVNSTTNYTGSSKKLKSLKKSSSGSSTSSTTSLSASSSSSSTSTPNCYPTSSSANVTSDKEKDKHQRHRTTSSGSNSATTTTSNTPATPYVSSKKRQLNFELELTKDMHLINSVTSSASKHKKDTKSLSTSLEDIQGHVAAKRARKELTSTTKEDSKNGTNKQHHKISSSNGEKIQDKKLHPTSLSLNSSNKLNATTSTSQTQLTSLNATKCSSSTTLTETDTILSNIVMPQPPIPAPVAPILREHLTLPHFNNVVLSPNTILHAGTASIATATPTPTRTPPPPQQNIPTHVNSPNFMPTTLHNSHQHQLSPHQHPPLPPTPPPLGGNISSPNVNSTNQLPFFNTIYGKLLDNPTIPTPSLPTPVTPSNVLMPSTTPPPMIGSTSNNIVAAGVLSEYQDTKIKSYNTLGGYVSHTVLFGLNNTTIAKDTASITAIKDSALNEMPAPLPPPAASPVAASSTACVNASAGSSTSSTTPLKILTKTASHDPRLNPHLTAPEPPPQPKRKLSINEYRKRMQQSSSNDSACNITLATTPTTPPSPMESLSSLTSVVLTNKCTLNSPDRLTQCVDSQIQKEILSTTSSLTSAHNALDSLNSSTTSNSSLNDTLLKSSSYVEEDSTKGQFNAAPTLLEKQQESLCARLKSLKEKQSLGASFSVGSCGNRSRFSSFSESVVSSDFGLRKDDDLDIIRNRNHSISSSIGGGDLLDNCLEEISSTSTSMSSSREPSPERYTHHKILTASATTTLTNTNATSNSNSNGPNRQPHNNSGDINDTKMAGLERKLESVDIA